jgi:hypothetical protein
MEHMLYATYIDFNLKAVGFIKIYGDEYGTHIMLFLDFQTVVFGFPNSIIYRSCY